jgi:hypothetical protein
MWHSYGSRRSCRRLALSSAILFVTATLSSCQKDIRQSRPELYGPSAGDLYEELAFTTYVADPRGRDVAYEFAWGDTSYLQWSQYYPSGQPLSRTRAYTDTGVYAVRVKAKDSNGTESKWSDPLDVVVGLAPSRPSLEGRSVWLVAKPCTLNATSYDPWGRPVSIGVHWGDGSAVEWSDTASGYLSVDVTHTYTSVDTYYVWAEAHNDRGFTSRPSDSLQLRVETAADTLAIPSIAYEVMNNGLTLRVHWTAVEGAEWYEITLDDTFYTTTATSFDLLGPSGMVEVRARNHGQVSAPASIDCRVVGTDQIVLFGRSGSSANDTAGLAFATDGTASALPLDDGVKAALDFVYDDVAITGGGLVNAGDYGWSQNVKLNLLMDVGTTDYDAFTLAALNGYISQLAITANTVYAFWLSSSSTWSTNDHFCKAKVITIERPSGTYYKATLKLAYQRIGGLRWLK